MYDFISEHFKEIKITFRIILFVYLASKFLIELGYAQPEDFGSLLSVLFKL